MAEKIDRRRFARRLGVSALVAGGAIGLGYVFSSTGEEESMPPIGKPIHPGRYRKGIDYGKPYMAVARSDPDGGNLVEACIEALGGMERFVKKGEVVFIKPNAAFDRPPLFGSTTSPEVVARTVELCFKAGASRVVVSDNPINKPEACFWKSGIGPAAKKKGAEVIIPQEKHFQRVPIPGSRAIGTWQIFRYPLDIADRVIGIAPLKDHNLCKASMGLKNWYGLLGGRRQQFHQDIHEVIADFMRILVPTLTILDCTRVLMKHGPTGGALSDVKRKDMVVASTDPVAADAFGWTLLERDSGIPRYIALSAKQGFGILDWKSLDPLFVEPR